MIHDRGMYRVIKFQFRRRGRIYPGAKRANRAKPKQDLFFGLQRCKRLGYSAFRFGQFQNDDAAQASRVNFNLSGQLQVAMILSHGPDGFPQLRGWLLHFLLRLNYTCGTKAFRGGRVNPQNGWHAGQASHAGKRRS